MKHLLTCAALLFSAPLFADQFDSGPTSQCTNSQPQPLTLSPWTGQIFFGLLPSYNIEDETAPKVLVVELCGTAQVPTSKNYFGTKGYTHSCIYMPLSLEEAENMADNVREWVKSPYISHFVYRKDVD